eukprot:symbB.v1.2.026329.t1/scaffold2623.1/size98372/1
MISVYHLVLYVMTLPCQGSNSTEVQRLQGVIHELKQEEHQAHEATDEDDVVRILILGQKDAMIFSLYQLVQLRRCRTMEVLVLTPDNNPTVPPSADVASICRALGYQHRIAPRNGILLEAVQSLRPHLLVSILWPRRVPKSVLELCKDSINFHPSHHLSSHGAGV